MLVPIGAIYYNIKSGFIVKCYSLLYDCFSVKREEPRFNYIFLFYFLFELI